MHQNVLAMADPEETDPLKRLAALLLHAADLANGADAWSISKLWAQWCHRGECNAAAAHVRNFSSHQRLYWLM